MSPSSSVIIRPVRPDDRFAVGRLGEMMVALHHRFDPARFVPVGAGTASSYGDYLTSQCARPDVVVLVVEAAGEIVGYSYAGIEGNDWMALRGPAGVVYDLIVDPGRRREGLGRRLLEATRTALLSRGAPRIVLWTAERNVPGQALFGEAGFRPTMIEMTWDPPQPE